MNKRSFLVLRDPLRIMASFQVLPNLMASVVPLPDVHPNEEGDYRSATRFNNQQIQKAGGLATSVTL